MSFAERIATPTAASKPSCWGSKAAYSDSDDDCNECSTQQSCKQEIVNKSARLYGISPTPPSAVSRPAPMASSYRSTYTRPTNAEGPTWTPGLAAETDNPFTRVLKDMLVAGLGGALREGGRFFDHFRMK